MRMPVGRREWRVRHRLVVSAGRMAVVRHRAHISVEGSVVLSSICTLVAYLLLDLASLAVRAKGSSPLPLNLNGCVRV